MGTLKSLEPSEAFEGATRRSFAAAAAGFLVGGSLYAIGAIGQPFIIISSVESAFFGVLTMSLAYYYKHWKFGVLGGALSILLPCILNLVWVRFSNRSLVYPGAGLVLFGAVFAGTMHRKISGPRLKDDAEEEIIRQMMDESEPTWTTGP